MTALLINPNEDGTVTVVDFEAPPEALAQGETFASMEEALEAVEAITQPEEAQEGEGGEAPPLEGEEAGEAGMPGMHQGEDMMENGYRSAKRGG